MSRMGFINFRDKIRQRSGLADLHVARIHTDGGSEYGGSFARAIATLHAAHPTAYVHTKTSGSRSSSNAIAERCIGTIRRIIYSHYRSVQRGWDDNNVPTNVRRYDWLDYLQRYEDTSPTFVVTNNAECSGHGNLSLFHIRTPPKS